MKHGLGFNNHRHLIYNLMAKNTDKINTQMVEKFIVKLLDLTSTITQPFRSKYQVVLQFGHESWPFLSNPSLLQFLKQRCKVGGVTPIIHQLDHIHPLTEGFSDWAQRYLNVSQEVGSPYLIIHLPPHPMNVLKETAEALTVDQVLDALSRNEVSIALENLCYEEPTPFFGQLKNVATLLEKIVSELKKTQHEDLERRFRICFDYGHFTEYAHHCNQDVKEKVGGFLSVMDERIEMLHVHTNDGTADQHLLPGEYPRNVNLRMLKKLERICLATLKRLSGKNRIFIVERNSPFQIQAMIHCFQILDQALSV
ncbi:MAG: Xylose isomerase-like TIM barrel [Candidatus Bathyarchaeota archaeon BA1]|nr:MAG: Xylose isomerase-like TIM barrel [Candidatus Bathyarchaeota archaeon BA1]